MEINLLLSLLSIPRFMLPVLVSAPVQRALFLCVCCQGSLHLAALPEERKSAVAGSTEVCFVVWRYRGARRSPYPCFKAHASCLSSNRHGNQLAPFPSFETAIYATCAGLSTCAGLGTSSTGSVSLCVLSRFPKKELHCRTEVGCGG